MKKVGHTSEFPFSIIDELWKTRKIRILKKEKKGKKKCWRYHHFTHVYQKPQSYEIQFLGHGVRQIFYVIFGHFLPFDPPNNPKNQNFGKIKTVFFLKKRYHFTLVYHKWQSYDIWFLRYQLQQTDFFFILGHFLPFYSPLTSQKMNISKKLKKLLKISSIYTCVTKNMVRWCTVPEIWFATDGWTDGRTDGRKKDIIEVVPHLKRRRNSLENSCHGVFF